MADSTRSKSAPVSESSDEVATAQETFLITSHHPVAEQFRDWVARMVAESENSDEENWEITANQLEKMLTATTFDDIMDSDVGGTHQGRDLVGFEFTVHPQRFRFGKSDDTFKAPLKGYIQVHAIALMDYETENISVGDDVLISCGAPLVMGKLRTLQANDHLPANLKIQAAGGKGVLRLARAPRRAVSGQTA